MGQKESTRTSRKTSTSTSTRESTLPAVLRVKQGYNPNSSSVGSQIPVFLGAALAAGAGTVIALQVLLAAEKMLHRERDRLDPAPAGAGELPAPPGPEPAAPEEAAARERPD